MFLDTFIHWLHVVAAIVWMGGMIFTSWVLQPVMRGSLSAPIRMPLYHEMGKKFKTISLVCLAVLGLTGLQKMWPMIWLEPAAFLSPYGKILCVKLVLVGFILVLSYLHSWRWGPRLTLLKDKPDSPEFQNLVKKLFFWGRLNLALSFVVVFCAALLHINPF